MTWNDNMPTPLNSSLIFERCRSEGFEVEVEVLDTVDSTNSRLLEADISSPVFLCAAERQTVGRGRRGKVWYSPESGVTFSMRFNLTESVSRFNGLSLLVGAILCDSLRGLGVVDAMVKWPNDVLVHGSKLAGILIESRTTGLNKESVLVVGIGVNYKRGEEARLIDQASTDLDALCGSGELPDRSVLIGDIATRLLSVVSEDVPGALIQLSARWHEYDALNGTRVIAKVASECIHGRAAGIDINGNLRIDTADGIRCLNSADVSVQPEKD